MKEEYLEGNVNLLKRAYFYLSNGLAVVNEFRNLLYGAVFLYGILKLEDKVDNPILIISTILVATIILLIPTGYVKVHHVAKVQEWLTVKYGSHYQVKNYSHIEEQIKILNEIKDSLDRLNK